ncbi:MAG: exosortase B [Burkholderiaceae bacterium]|jgi:exosortase B|nr:exosortase B [Burkholderiaceae bacterium]
MTPAAALQHPLAPFGIVALGALALYVPSFRDLLNGIWGTDQQGHGPLVLAISLWLLWRKGPELLALPDQPARSAGWGCFAIAMLLYAFGRTQGIQMFEVGSLIWLVVSALLLFRGSAALKVVWFPLFFMLFMVPLPGVVVDTLTQPMKLAVSTVAEWILWNVGYPVARTGVILQVGSYQLLVADACAGLNTLLTLEALGLLYLNLVRHESALRNITLAILIVPISFAANVIRVIALTLITYHFGDEAGQGFLHGFAGMVLFMAALMLIIAADTATRAVVRMRTAPPA